MYCSNNGFDDIPNQLTQTLPSKIGRQSRIDLFKSTHYYKPSKKTDFWDRIHNTTLSS